jgi:hypothetical protein
MKDIIGGIFLLALGLYAAIFYKHNARKTVEFWYQLTHIRPSERINQIGFLLTGVIFAIVGILALIGLINFR